MTDDVTDEGDRDLCFCEELFEGCIFKIVCRLLSSLLILFDTSENLVDCFFGPRQGDTGTVTARFDTFGTPICPAWYLLLAEDGIGRALKRLFEALVVWVLQEVFLIVPDTLVVFLSRIIVLGTVVVSLPGFRRREPNNGEHGVVVGRFFTLGTPTPPKPTPRFVLRLLLWRQADLVDRVEFGTVPPPVPVSSFFFSSSVSPTVGVVVHSFIVFLFGFLCDTTNSVDVKCRDQ